ncbi:hypothetical protein ACVWWN_000809 [Mycobacterium sp. URHB0021]
MARSWTEMSAAVRMIMACCVVVLASVAVVGCATGSGAVASGGTFDFVSPGGKTVLFYDPPSSRGTIGAVSGPDLMTDGKILAV